MVFAALRSSSLGRFQLLFTLAGAPEGIRSLETTGVARGDPTLQTGELSKGWTVWLDCFQQL